MPRSRFPVGGRDRLIALAEEARSRGEYVGYEALTEYIEEAAIFTLESWDEVDDRRGCVEDLASGKGETPH